MLFGGQERKDGKVMLFGGQWWRDRIVVMLIDVQGWRNRK